MTEVLELSLLRCGCGVSRFSCPENSIGNYANHSCGFSNGRSALEMKKNEKKHIVTGTIKHVQNDRLCDCLEDCIPFYCQCELQLLLLRFLLIMIKLIKPHNHMLH